VTRVAAIVAIALAGCSGSSSTPPPLVQNEPEPVSTRASKPRFDAPKSRNYVFTDPTPDRMPTIRSIALPPFHAAAAVWGGTGRDHRGHVFFGVSADGDARLSAHLVEYDPATGLATDRGGAVENLRRLGLGKPGENQNKIHTKIWQAADGWLHFASMDEGGEAEDGSRPPTFGSHLWRVRPDAGEWEHLAEVREAVVASAIGGRFVYYLGYFGHVLHQWDAVAGRLTGRVRVGSVGGHTSRNILADSRGHVYVPRVTATAVELVELVEFDETLREVAAFPLAGYGTAPDSSSHGIVGFAALKDDGFAFVTDRGRLYRLTPRATGGALVELGTMHPAGECYCPSLVSVDGASVVAGLGRRPGAAAWEWLTFDLKARRAAARSMEVPAEGTDVLVYGSATRDDSGRLYLGGRSVVSGRSVARAWALVP
jgi:hypothetical protein